MDWDWASLTADSLNIAQKGCDEMERESREMHIISWYNLTENLSFKIGKSEYLEKYVTALMLVLGGCRMG